MAIELRKTPEPNLPKPIGRYQAFLQIGAGGMARVYLAAQRGHAHASNVVVVKILRREVVEDEYVLAMFMDEARIATRLRHPNVIVTREVVTEPPDYLLAMDFHEGQSLLQVLRRLGRGAVPLEEHIWIISQVLAGLSHAHELKDDMGRPLGIVHRDVSPSNVLVCYTGEIKLIDFGIAKATGALAATQDGVVKGKVGYAAPEQCLGKPADPRSDIYAVGVMVWEAIAGRRRASGETWHSVLQARIEDSEPTLREVCPDAPADLCAIAERALAHEPEARYQTAREFQKDLEAYLTAQHAKIGPVRIAAMLRPHFEQDRADQRRAIETHLSSLRTRISGQMRRVPLPGPLPAVEPEASCPNEEINVEEEEDTSKIPVDDALLIRSRGGSGGPPAYDSTPSVPKIPPHEAPKFESVGPASGARAIPSKPEAAPAAESSAALNAEMADLRRSEPPIDDFGPLRTGMLTRPQWVAVAAGVCVMGLAGFLIQRGHSDATGGQPSSASAIAVAPAVQPAPATGSGHLVPNVNQVRVRISVSPPEAEMRLDGRLLKGNPFVSVFPKDDAIHELSADAEGYREEKQVIQFIEDVDLQVSLRRGRSAPRGAGASPHGVGAGAAARPTGEARTGAVVEPGMDLQARPENRVKHNIDEKDPYSQ